MHGHEEICSICKYADNAAADIVLFYFNEQCFPRQTDNVITRSSSSAVGLSQFAEVMASALSLCSVCAWLSHRPPLMEKLITTGVISHDTGVNLIMLTK